MEKVNVLYVEPFSHPKKKFYCFFQIPVARIQVYS